MSYPQPPASTEVLQGQEFWRLYTPMDSSGDIYEMDVSAKAFCIGPQSDLARARITYYDPELPSNSQSFVVSLGDFFAGRIDCFASQQYPVAKIGAKILISPEDLIENPAAIMDNAAVLVTFPNALDVVAYSPPVLDLLAYLSPPPTLPDKRADRYFRGLARVVDRGVGTGVTYLLIPYYGRKYASIKFQNNTANPYTVTTVGVSIFPYAPGATTDVSSTGVVLNSTPIVGGATASPEIRASVNGLWDYLVVMVAGNAVGLGNLRYTIQTTDEE